MFFKSKYVFILILLLPVLLWSQEFIVQGIVKNAQSGEVLTGVNISVKNSDMGVTTDEDGYFELNFELTGEPVLEFQFIGFSSRSIPVKEAGEWLEVQLIPEMLRTEPIVVTGVRAEKRKSPVPFTSLDKKYIKENYGAQDVPMLLKEIPGVYAYSDNGTGIGYSYLKIRGFDAKRVSVMINGIPHNDPEEHSVYWVDMPDLAESATSLQVQRGVGISPYAVSSFGGSVNLLTTGIPTKFGPEVTFGIGSYNTQKYTANVNTKLNDNYYATFRLSKITTDGYRDRSDVDLWSYYFKLVRTGKKSFTQLNIYGGNEKTHASWEASPESELKKNHKHNPYEYHNEIDYFNQPHYELINNYKINSKLDFNNTFFYIHGDGYYEQLKTGKDLWNYGLLSQPDSVEADLVRQKHVKKDQIGWISEFNLKHHSNYILTAGIYLSNYSSVHNGEIEELNNLYNLVDSINIAENSISLYNIGQDYYRYVYDKNYYNFYLLEKGNIFNGKLSWQANLYFQNVNFSFKHRQTGNFDGENLHAYNINYIHISPRFGINYNVNKNWNTYFSLSTAEKEPNADDVFDNWYGPDDLGISPKFTKSDTIYKNGHIDHIKWKNPVINEEKLIDFEAGIGYRNSKISTELNLYRMYFKDEIVPFGAVDDDGYDVKGNADETIHEGFEFNINFMPNNKIIISNNFSYSNNYFKKFVQESLSGEGVINHKDKKIAGFPDWLSNTTFLMSYNQFKIKLTHRYTGRIYLDNTENKERSINPTNNIFDIQLLYNVPEKIIKQNLEIIFQVNNLLEEKYYTSGYYYYGNNLVPAATRNFLLTFRMSM